MSKSTRAAIISGTFLRPGVSKNNRLYSAEAIGKAVTRMQEQIASPEGLPMHMATSHGKAATDDLLSNVAMITRVHQDTDGSAKFEADILDTTNGRDAAVAAVAGAAKGISIRGGWMSKSRLVEGTEGVTTADDLAVIGIDFTGSPGVIGAQIESAQFAESFDGLMSPVFSESVEEAAVIEVFNEEAPEEETKPTTNYDEIREAFEETLSNLEAAKEPYGAVTYADPGYQTDKQKRYPVNTAKRVRAAWSYINVSENQKPYSTNQVARIKSRIKGAAKKFGINIQTEQEELKNGFLDVIEAYVSMSLDNGAGSISVSGSTNDAGKLEDVANSVAASVIAALNALDPDADGDIDIPGGSSSDDDAENAPNVLQAESTDDASNQTKEEPIMATDEKTAEEAATEIVAESKTVTLTEAEVQALIANSITAYKVTEADAAVEAKKVVDAAAEAEKIAAESTTTQESEVTEAKTFTQKEVDALIASGSASAVAEAKEKAAKEYKEQPTRKGLVSESLIPDFGEDEEADLRALSEMSLGKFQTVAGETFGKVPFFAKRFAAADAAASDGF